MSSKKTKQSENKPLDAKETVFKDQYLISKNPREAAIAAGYAESTAKSKAFTWVNEAKCPANKLHLFKAIKEGMEELSKKAGIDAEWVLRQAKEVHLRCMQAAPVYDRKGNQVYIENAEGDIVPAFTFEHTGANKALEIIGKHVSVQAFRENIHLTKDQLSDLSDEDLQAIVDGRYKP